MYQGGLGEEQAWKQKSMIMPCTLLLEIVLSSYSISNYFPGEVTVYACAHMYMEIKVPVTRLSPWVTDAQVIPGLAARSS